VQFALRKWQYALVAILVSTYVDVYSPLPVWSHVPVIVFFMAILALNLYGRKIWLMADEEAISAGPEPR
jgi:hypothetical protein